MELMNEIFLDSAFFKALIDLKDDFHSQAEKIWGELKISKVNLVTTNFILDETFTLIRIKCGYKPVFEFRDRLVAGFKRMKVYRITLVDEANAWKWFAEEWKKLSFTDCTSFAVMERLGLKQVATFDEHFAKAGFEVLAG